MYRKNFSHSVPTMVGFFGDSENLLSALPAEFSKSEFNAIRKTIGGHPICFESARKYGIIKVVRTEPCFRKMLIDVWTNPVTGDKYTCDELERKWSQEIAEQFGQPFLVKCWSNSGRLMTPSPYSIPNYQEEELEVECYRNIFVLDLEKFKSLL